VCERANRTRATTPFPGYVRRKYSWPRCHARACVCTRVRIIAADEPRRRACTRIRDDFKRPSVFRELKLLAGVGSRFSPSAALPPQNCGTFVTGNARISTSAPSRIIPAFARERRLTTCGLSLSTYGEPACINAIRHPRRT